MIDRALARPLTIRDRTQPLEADVVPGLGMVVSSMRHEGRELLGQRGGLQAYAAKGQTFGISLLYPWANRLSGWNYRAGGQRVELDPADPLVHKDPDTGLPLHGLLAASREWRLTDADLDTIEAELDFGAEPQYLRSFPFPHRLTYRATIKQLALTIALTVTPTSDLPVPICFGFHPYVRLPGSERDRWRVQLPLALGAAAGALAGREYDTAFDELGDEAAPTFLVGDEQRQVSIEFSGGYPVAQVFSPSGSDFICFEPMSAPVDALRSGKGLRFAQPGSPFTASFVVAVRGL